METADSKLVGERGGTSLDVSDASAPNCHEAPAMTALEGRKDVSVENGHMPADEGASLASLGAGPRAFPEDEHSSTSEETLEGQHSAGQLPSSKSSSDLALEPLKMESSYEDLLSVGEPSQNFHTKGVRVVVRCRPLLSHESKHEKECLSLDRESKSVTLQSKNVDERMRHFFFDEVLDESCSQQEACDRVQMGPMVDAVLSGYHATVFCYGQTGSGKTHTMEGFTYKSKGASSPKAQLDADPEQLGLIARSISLLFENIKRKKKAEPHVLVNVKCSMVQIYKEQVYDLLNPHLAAPNAAFSTTNFGKALARPPQQVLKVRWNRRREFYLENVFEYECKTPEEALEHFRFGVNNKTMASHKMNMASSRSHALFTVIVDTAPASAPEDAVVSKLCLVDLAGYERSAQSGSTSGQLQQESIFINKSLFTLRKVITALADPHYKGMHVPYRDSKLTCLLKHSLGGNSLTLMIACLAPSDAYWEDNLSTLEYASKTKQISNQVAVNEDPKNRVIRRLRERVLFLEHQLAALTVSPVFSQGSEWPGTPTWQSAQDTAVLSTFSTSTTSPRGESGRPEGTSSAVKVPDKLVEQIHYQTRNESVDELGIGKRLVASVDYIKKILTSNEELRSAVGKEHQSNESLQEQNAHLMQENQDLRERLGVLESVVVMEDEERKAVASLAAEADAPAAAEAAAKPGTEHVLTAGSAALLELIDLRKENKELREMLRRWECGTQTRGNTRARSRSPSKAATRPAKSQTLTANAHASGFRRGSDTPSASSPYSPYYSPKNGRASRSAGVSGVKRATKEPPKTGLLTLDELRGIPGARDGVTMTSQSGRHGSPLRPRSGRLLVDDVTTKGEQALSVSKSGTAPSPTWPSESLASPWQDDRRGHTGAENDNPGRLGLLSLTSRGGPDSPVALATVSGDTSSTLAQLSELIRTRNELTKNHTRLPAIHRNDQGLKPLQIESGKDGTLL